jgi:hypothetical protein
MALLDLFKHRFGLKGPELRRLVIQAGNINYPMVEIYPPKFTVFVHGEPELNEFEICCSKSQTVGSLKSLIIKQINPDLPPATVRLWSGFDRNTMEKREDLIQTIGESTLSSDRLIMVEKKIGDTWQYEQRY